MSDIKPIRLFNIYGFTGMNYAGNVWDINGLSPALLTMTGGNRQPLIIIENEGNKMSKIRIRKLTPTECYKLMGFTAEDCLAVKVGNREIAKGILKKYSNHFGKRVMAEAERINKMSNAQLYKQAGNSIVVNVLEAIFTSLGERYEEFAK